MLRIISSNRQEALFERLAECLEQRPTDDPFAAETIIAERGTDTWLWQQFAARDGIAAGLDVQMPAGFVWKTLRAVVPGLPHESPFDTAPVAWRLMALLPPLLDKPGFEDLRHYLCRDALCHDNNAAPDPRRLYQLCQRIAGTFDQYLVYRPELVAAWEAGKSRDLGPDEGWQKVLWRALVAELGDRHRANLLREFETRPVEDLARAKLPARVSVFGIPALPPAYLRVLERLAEVRDVDFYLLNPSTVYWGDLPTPAQAAQIRARLGRHGGALIEVPNRLLASWGQQARDFVDDIYTRAAEFEDLYVEPERHDRLSLVQADILNLTEARDVVVPANDTSIQLHAAHSRMREVEVLHDQLLDLFHRIDGLTPRDVLVLAPDIGAYAPLVDAVFGSAGDGARALPWAIADLPRQAEDPLLAAITQLLRLPAARLRASEVLGLLEQPAIRRAARIEDDHVDDIRQWVSAANIRWGYDADARAALGLPAEDAHTWAFGLRRLFLGAAMSGREDLIDGIAACTQVEGQRATALGLLRTFIDALHDWQGKLAGQQDAAQWARTIRGLLDAFVKPRADDEQDTVDAVRGALDAQLRELRDGGITALAMDSDVLRDDLVARLAAPAPRNDFLGGAITFASLVPMRSLPFRVIALLGMNQEDFPRRQNAVGFDLVAQQPRRGDRSRRNDDRHLFLETVLSARDVLYISHVGRGIRDDKEMLPSVLVTELVEYLAAAAGCGDGKARKAFREALACQHPLQPFSARYFMPGEDAHQRLFTFNDDWRGAAQARVGDRRDAPPWCPQPIPPRAGDETRDDSVVPLDDLVRFLANPSAHFLQRRFDVRMRDDHDVALDDEPFELDALESWQVKDAWVREALAGADDATFRRRLAARGDLPQGPMAAMHWHRQKDGVADLLAALRDRVVGARTVAIDVALGTKARPRRLTGQVAGVTDAGLVAWKAGNVSGKEALAFWVRHLALCAQGELGEKAASCLLNGDGGIEVHVAPLSVADAKKELLALLALYERGAHEPLPLFPKASWAWTRADADDARDDAERAFEGSGEARGDCADEAIRAVWRSTADALDGEFAALADAVFSPLAEHAIDDGEDA